MRDLSKAIMSPQSSFKVELNHFMTDYAEHGTQAVLRPHNQSEETVLARMSKPGNYLTKTEKWPFPEEKIN